MNSTTIKECRLIELQKFGSERRGNLTQITNGKDIPFEIHRVFYLYDIPAGAERGAHAHRELNQLIVPVSGSFDVVLSDGRAVETFNMNKPYCGLFIPEFIWGKLENFSAGSICLVFASERFDEESYIRSYDQFLTEKGISNNQK